MFTPRSGFRSWWRKANLFVSWLWRLNEGRLQMWDIKNPNRLEIAKSELRSLQANSSWLGPSLLVKGEISGAEDLLIDGSVEGVVRLSEGQLTIGPAARLTASITAGDVLVRGNVKGNVCAKGRIEIGNEASVTGDLRTRQVFIESGAWFKGSLEIEKSTEKATGENTLCEAKSAASKVRAAAAGAKNI